MSIGSGAEKLEWKDMDIDKENKLRPFKQQICLFQDI